MTRKRRTCSPARRLATISEKEATMIDLTEEQRRELRRSTGGELRVSDPETHEEYVLLKARVYERLKALLYDDGEAPISEAYPLIDEMAAKAGWDDPEMDVYNDLIPKDRQ